MNTYLFHYSLNFGDYRCIIMSDSEEAAWKIFASEYEPSAVVYRVDTPPVHDIRDYDLDFSIEELTGYVPTSTGYPKG